MGVALSLIAIIVLVVLLGISYSKQREAKVADRELKESMRDPEVEAEREARRAASIQRREEVRAAFAERTRHDETEASVVASDRDA
jgi:hypothetical protein